MVADVESGWYVSEPVPVPVLNGSPCRFVVDGYDDDPAPADFHTAIRTFLALDRSTLTAAAPAIYEYYRDTMKHVVAAGYDDLYVAIEGPEQVLAHVSLGTEPTVVRDTDGDEHVYVSLECECDWEPEHGLRIAFRDGATVTKVGPYDGAL